MDARKTITDAIKESKLLMGRRSVFRSMSNRELNLIIRASNCPDDVKRDLDRYSEISGIRLEDFKGNSSQLGEMCGKPFSILVVGIRK
jgi:large subunit ribosomal protein L30e